MHIDWSLANNVTTAIAEGMAIVGGIYFGLRVLFAKAIANYFIDLAKTVFQPIKESVDKLQDTTSQQSSIITDAVHKYREINDKVAEIEDKVVKNETMLHEHDFILKYKENNK